MSAGNKLYFASDIHLGAGSYASSREREDRFVRWLDVIKTDAAEVFIMGDLFDFWFEYRYVVPKGHVRLLGKLAEFADRGIPVHIFTGNHDVWMFDYFTEEFGAHIHRHAIKVEWAQKRFMIGHGDGLGPGDKGYKFIKAIFHNPLAQRLFAALHPFWGVKLAHYFSRKSRESTGDKDSRYLGDDKEFLVRYCHEVLRHEHIDYFIFGHRHMVLDKQVGAHSRYINLGEWFKGCHYAKFDGEQLSLHRFEA